MTWPALEPYELPCPKHISETLVNMVGWPSGSPAVTYTKNPRVGHYHWHSWTQYSKISSPLLRYSWRKCRNNPWQSYPVGIMSLESPTVRELCEVYLPLKATPCSHNAHRYWGTLNPTCMPLDYWYYSLSCRRGRYAKPYKHALGLLFWKSTTV